MNDRKMFPRSLDRNLITLGNKLIEMVFNFLPQIKSLAIDLRQKVNL